MRQSFVSILQLIRLPNVITAAADSLAGWLLVGGALAEVSGWLPLAGASMCLYAAGMALNDFFDLDVDRRERPKRPLPSGRVSPKTAAAIGWAGLTLGLVLALVAGAGGLSSTLIVGVLLAAAILSYDAGLKDTFLGPWAMGSCRALNMLLGMSVAVNLGGPIAWLAAGAFGLFVVGVTWISRSEAFGGETRNLTVGMTLQNVAFLGLAAAALMPGRFPYPTPNKPLLALEGLLVLGMIAVVVNNAAARAIREPNPQYIQQAVKTGVLSLVWLDVALVASVRGPSPAFAVALFWLPAFLLARWLYST